MTYLPITSTIAALLAIMMFMLTLAVSLRRASLGKAAGDLTKHVFGDGGDETLMRRNRAFGNFIEYVPACLIMLTMIELSGASSTLIWPLGGTFVVGRILHALGMLINPYFPPPRGLGMLSTYATLLIPAIWLLTH